MRIAIFAETYLPYLSGVTVSTETLARSLGAAGHEVVLVAPSPAAGVDPGTAGALGPDPTYAWLPSVQLPAAPPGYRVPLPAPSAASRIVEDFAPEVIHAQSPFVSGLMARRLARRLGVPLVFTHHTRFADYRHYAGPLAGLAGRASTVWLDAWWKGCAGVIAPSDDLAVEIRAALGPRRRPLIRAIPTGVNVAAIAATEEGHPRRESGWPMDSIVLVSVGRVASEKSVDLLVEAVAAAVEREPRLRLLLVGGGGAEADVAERAARLGIGDRVRVTGLVPHELAMSLLRASDVFVFASRTETQGLVLAEALSAGVPVVAMDGPGVSDSVRHRLDGIVVAAEPSEGRTARLATGILELASHPRRRARFAAAARLGAERFDVGARVEQVVAFYRDVTPR
jgi:glycosyltransferase involved in cell wall biosynthesis